MSDLCNGCTKANMDCHMKPSPSGLTCHGYTSIKVELAFHNAHNIIYAYSFLKGVKL